MCGELIIDNLEDFLFCDYFDSSIEGRCSVDKMGKPDLDKCHLVFQVGESKTPCFIYICVGKVCKFLLIQQSLIV